MSSYQGRIQDPTQLVLRQRNERLSLLSDIAGLLLLSDDPREILDNVFKMLSAHLGLEAYFNYLVTDDGSRMRLYEYGGITADMAKEIEWLEYGQAVCGCVARDRERMIAEDVQCSSDPRTDLIRSLGITAYCCHPLIAHGRLIGTLSFGTRGRTNFSDDEIALMHTVCDLVATSLERAKLITGLKTSRMMLEEKVKERTIALQEKQEELEVQAEELEVQNQELLKSNEALRIAEETSSHLAFIVESSNSAIVGKALDGTITSWNAGAERMFGYSAGEVIGRNISILLPPGHHDELPDILDRIKNGEYIDHFETVRRRKDGALIDISLSVSPIKDRSGKIVGASSIKRDITERKRAEEVLRENEARRKVAEAVEAERKRLYDILETLPAYLILLSPDYRVPYANRFFRERFGESRGLRCFEYLFGRSEPCENCETFKVLKTGSPHRWEWTGPDGRHYDIYDYPFKDEDGSPLIMEMGIDITERKKAEEALRESEQKLRWANRALRALSMCKEAMVRAEDEASLLEDICHIVVDVGGYRLAWIGYVEDDGLRTVRPVARAGYDDGYVDSLQIALNHPVYGNGPTGISLKSGKPYRSRNIESDGTMRPWRSEALKRGYLSTLNLPLMHEDQTLGTLVIYSDRPGAFDDEELGLLADLADNLAFGIRGIRNRVRRSEAEQELLRAKEDLEVRVEERTQELKSAKEQAELYVDLMGHDINNLNQSAMGFLELALETLEAENRLKKEDKVFIERPLAALESSSRLIENVRKLQRLIGEGIKTMPIDLGKVLKDIDVEGIDHNGREITINIPVVQDCIVAADELLRDVFLNLITNAAKHSDEEKPLTVDVKIEPFQHIGGMYYKCTVEDNGPGIPDGLKPRLFHRFQRGATKAHGKGLGLYLIRTLVEGYGGKVWVEDRVPGDHTKGARFVVLLPAVEK